MQDKPNKDVWVFVEQRDGQAADVSLELLCKGKKLADAMGGQLAAVILAQSGGPLIEQAFLHYADQVFVVQHAALTHYRTQPYSRILTELVELHRPRVLLFGATIVGRDLAPRVASATRSGLTADCTDLVIADVSYQRVDRPQLLLQIRPAFGGNIVATIISPECPTQMATVREGVMEKSPLGAPRLGRVTEIAYQPHALDELVQIVARVQQASRINLKAAPIVVAGGYGMRTRKNFQLLHDLARALGGEVAASRAAVDAGFASSERQVGQTGVTVRPKLYIAAGISGAIQHRAGMQNSSKIIAINTDPEAPIFDVAHYGIVGDAMDVIPQFIDAYRQRLK
jgi:electron transfer flavoprotein alpha subunit